MKYMLMFWEDESAAAMEVAAAHPLARTGTVEVRPLGDFPGDQ